MASAGRAALGADDAANSPAAADASADRRDSCCSCMLIQAAEDSCGTVAAVQAQMNGRLNVTHTRTAPASAAADTVKRGAEKVAPLSAGLKFDVQQRGRSRSNNGIECAGQAGQAYWEASRDV